MKGEHPGSLSQGIYYEVHGSGIPLFLGFPIMASYGGIFGEANASVLSGFLDRLTDRYRVLVVDYPSIGKSVSIPPTELTGERVSADMLAVADAAGFDDFAWWGGTWGAVVGLQLASRSERVSALVCSGWPPIGAPYTDMLRGVRANVANPPPHARVILRDPSQYAQWVSFYESIQDWPEAQAVARIQCPRMAVFGSEAEGDVAGIPLPFGATIRERRAELEALGWRVTEIPGRDNSVMIDPLTIVPVVRKFLDAMKW
ncbi:MAG: alpha/beta fold hydrolase [Steroidobacteraceae bacterium]